MKRDQDNIGIDTRDTTFRKAVQGERVCNVVKVSSKPRGQGYINVCVGASVSTFSTEQKTTHVYKISSK